VTWLGRSLLRPGMAGRGRIGAMVAGHTMPSMVKSQRGQAGRSPSSGWAGGTPARACCGDTVQLSIFAGRSKAIKRSVAAPTRSVAGEQVPGGRVSLSAIDFRGEVAGVTLGGAAGERLGLSQPLSCVPGRGGARTGGGGGCVPEQARRYKESGPGD
jgi:hypothetical protein